MEVTTLYRDYIGDILRLYWDNGQENGNYKARNGVIWNGFLGRLLYSLLYVVLKPWGSPGYPHCQKPHDC